ncbi:hypothetical protein [Gardnerella sp. KA00255]|uniref:hypothetical protein n=1 Tax=Gardnerella sp. KA00255 TaxID=2749073 RepID=UPI003BAA06D7
MLNKKAIAALAAGATLVSGLAFATPSFAAEPQAPKKEECKVDAAKLNAAKLKAAQKLAAELTAKAALDEANAKVDTANTQLAKVKGLKKTLDDATTELNKTTAPDTKDNYSAKQKAELEKAKNEANEAYTKGLRDAETALGKNANDFADVNGVHTELRTLQGKAADAKDAYDQAVTERKAADAEVEKLSCTPAPAPQPGPQPGPKPLPDVPSIPLRDMDHDQIRALTRLENAYVVLKKDQAAFESLHSEYLKSKANYYSALAKYQAVDKEYVAAQQKVADLKAAGKEGTDAYKAALNDEQAVSARYTAVQASLDEAAADFQAKTVAVNAAADKFNADLVLYRNAYNNAVAVRANVSGFPKPDDVAKAPTFGVPNQVKEAAKKAEAKKGAVKKSGAAAPSGAKLDTKAAAAASAAPLSKTGVTVMFTALAASMLAGIGAAVRKFRH